MSFPNTRVIPIRFMGGLNSKLQSFTLDQPYLQDCQNGVYNQVGQIDKRTGFTAVSTNIQGGGNIEAGFSLTTFNNELLLFDGKNLYSWQDEENVWISRGTAFSTINQQTRVLNTKVATQSNPDCTSNNNVSLYVWEDNRAFPIQSNGIRYSVINNRTGTLIVSDGLIYFAGTRPKVVCNGTDFFVFYCASTDTILSVSIPVNRPNTLINQYNFVATDGYSFGNQQAAAIPYDALILAPTILPLVCYASTTGLRFNIPGSSVISTNTNIKTVSMCQDSFGKIWVSFSDTVNTYVGCFTVSWMPPFFSIVQVLPFQVVNRFTTEVSSNIAIIEDVNPGSVNLTTETSLAGNNNFCNNYTVSPKGESTFIGRMRGVGLASKPFKHNNNIFVNTVWSSSLQATYFTQCLTQGVDFVSGTANVQAGQNNQIATSFSIVSKHAVQNGGNYRTNSLLSECDAVDDGKFLFAGQRKGAFTSWQNAQTVNLGVAGYSVAFATDNSFNSVSANNNLHIVGGIKKIYDGVSCVEDNFNVFPENVDGYGCQINNSTPADGYYKISGGTGGLTYNPLFVINQYQWVVVYEWTDNYGQVQRSQVSIPITGQTSAPGQSASLTGPTLRLTEKVANRSSVIISIYRTQVNGTIFYKITDDNSPIVNNPQVDTWTFLDVSSDTDIQANENLYTGSQLSNTAPPPCSLISLNQQRIMINSTEDPGVLWYSQNKFEQDQYNTLGLDFNSSFVEGVDSREGNEITAIGLLDSTLAIFKETSIFLLQGDGPNALNTSGQFNDAQLLVSDTGCNNQNSLCFITQTPSLPGGLLFKSPKGIYLLGRDESLTYIGAPVEKYNNLTITSANLLASSNQVVFTTLEGTALVYNYFFNAWTTWENLSSIDACVWQGSLCILTTDGVVMMQDVTNTVWQDTYHNGVSYPISLDITTPFIKLQGLQNYQSVFACYLLGTLQDHHTLSVQVAYDYNSSNKGQVLIDSSLAANRWGGLPIWGSNGVWGSNQFANYQFQINVNNPRCQSIQFRIKDVSPNPTQGFSLNGLALECLLQPGAPRLPTSNKVGLI